MASKPSRRLNDKLDRYNPLMCCDESILKGYDPYISTYKKNFYVADVPSQAAQDRVSRLRYELRDAGLYPSSLLTGSPFYNSRERNYNTQYCEDFNKQTRWNVLPSVRQRNFRKGNGGLWEPEKSDNAIIGDPWNYGYRIRKEAQWAKQREEIFKLDSIHQYTPESTKYSRFSNEEYKNSERYATPLAISSKMFDPQQKVTRGPPLLHQPNQVGNCLPGRRA